MHHDKMRNAERSLGRKQVQHSTDKDQRVALLEIMITDFENVMADLDAQIATDEGQTFIKDSGYPQCSTFAKAAAGRRQNILMSLSHVRSILEMELRDRGPNQQDARPAALDSGSRDAVIPGQQPFPAGDRGA
jgi:flagellar protein FliJ